MKKYLRLLILFNIGLALSVYDDSKPKSPDGKAANFHFSPNK